MYIYIYIYYIYNVYIYNIYIYIFNIYIYIYCIFIYILYIYCISISIYIVYFFYILYVSKRNLGHSLCWTTPCEEIAGFTKPLLHFGFLEGWPSEKTSVNRRHRHRSTAEFDTFLERQAFCDTKNNGSVPTNLVAMEDSSDEWPKDWPKALFLRVYARTQLWDCGLTTTAKTLSCLNGDAVNTYLRLVSSFISRNVVPQKKRKIKWDQHPPDQHTKISSIGWRRSPNPCRKARSLMRRRVARCFSLQMQCLESGWSNQETAWGGVNIKNGMAW